jgi:hypothetical protein
LDDFPDNTDTEPPSEELDAPERSMLPAASLALDPVSTIISPDFENSDCPDETIMEPLTSDVPVAIVMFPDRIVEAAVEINETPPKPDSLTPLSKVMSPPCPHSE